ncbi:helix-turn-helix transcriptional regulator [Microlunatus parietis]|uniref:DNA-binding PadR family transcriptional regulator n=1 Tax=Microlunatus parietis TaxID=682979 RepID=A0A7Y9I450_9ACTN|nr:helix-turn-helix transcriptional regulator [Microlunatus parietis]NYE69926.1 DNA-binding PadR family transcriptional regulator [Microlunatus parietis]
MPLRATDNPLVLPLLGLLLEQPRHQYALLTDLRERYGMRVRTGSLYTLVGSIREAGWIEQTDSNRTPSGDKASPAVFRVTPAGQDEFSRRVVVDLTDTDPANATRFVTALAYIGILDRATARATLDARIDALEQHAQEWEQSIETSGLPPIYMIEADFMASQTRHDIAWLERFVQRISDPDEAWPADTPSTR